MKINPASQNQVFQANQQVDKGNSDQKISDRLENIDVNKVNKMFTDSLESFQTGSNQNQVDSNKHDCRWDQFGKAG